MSEPWATGKFSVSSTAKFSVIDVPQKGKGGGGGGGSAVPASTKDAAGLYKRDHMRVKEFLKLEESTAGTTVTVKGWVRTLREQGGGRFAFVELNDGSCNAGMQVLLNREPAEGDPATEGFAEAMAAGGTGSSMSFTGMISKSPAKGQLLELHAHSATVLGTTIAKEYPMSKKRHTAEQLRKVAHLRPRAKGHASAMRVRHAMAYATHKFFEENGFYYIHTPLITASDCEGAGEMFQVTTLLEAANKKAEEKGGTPYEKLARTKKGEFDYAKDFFGKKAFMTVSGQLNVETHACALGDVYTFGPTFRAEDSHTSRHLAEFWMIEPEISFADLAKDAELAEAYVKYCARYALENCLEDLQHFDQWVEKGLIARLTNVIENDFKILTYTEAIEILNQPGHLKKGKFEEKPDWGIDLGSEHERYLTEKVYKKPVILTHYPKEIKAFYMRLDDEVVDLKKYEGTKIGVAEGRTGETVSAMDILVPRIGELIGGSQREERLEKLEEAIRANGDDPKDYWWYCDLRRYGSVPHAGFGLGFERLIMFVTGIENIRDVIPFPRVPKTCDF